MAIKQIRDLLYGEEYESKGEKKTKWNKCGTVFIQENGNIGIKLTACPTGTQNLIAFPPKPKEETREPELNQVGTDISNLPF